MKSSTLSFLILTILFLTSCKSAQQRKIDAEEKYGYLPDEVRNLETIKAYASEWGIPQESLYIMDTKNYSDEIYSYESDNKRLTHDLYQWHQLMVFDQSDSLLSYQLNCTTKRVDNNWKWNYEGTFDQYPPKDKSVKKYQRELRLSNVSPYFKDLSGKPFSEKISEDTELFIIVYWTIYNGRQSKNLIEEVLNYRRMQADKKIELVFLNQPSVFIENEMIH
ncbi:hypothetical protein [Marivirga harenae]|uniref:hypothetical protein n=1 Tax=Marivirga harenae TaxID=2010992 RepID=UPI0026DFF854|nr:hypothetical protein [Marivirga harenae]WKV13268.1 hypothetical protein Q3Y49_05435 [Marivirga harenae]|tara:strand:+ start:81672 stop:82334 length:663 start_codon:yes stop_codon:yes gene_type:complete